MCLLLGTFFLLTDLLMDGGRSAEKQLPACAGAFLNDSDSLYVNFYQLDLMSGATGAANLPGLKKSIRRTVAIVNRRKINSESETAASPKLPVKRKRTRSLTEEEEGPTPKKMAAEKNILAALASLQESMGELRKKVDTIPNREDFERIDGSVKSIRRELANNTDRLDNLTKRQDEEKRDFVRNVERVIDQRMAYHKTTRTGVLTPTAGEAEKEGQFLLARRTMLLWPVNLTAEGNAARNFFETVLEIPVSIVKSLCIERVDKVQQARRSRIQDEVRVVFSTSKERDLVQSYAVNLAKSNGKAGIRMELPEHLRGLFKLFEAHGASLRQRFPGLRRSIKYDDVSQSLCMDVKMPEKDKWHRIGEAEMREIARRHGGGVKSDDPVSAEEAEDRRIILALDRAPSGQGVPVVEEDEDQ